MSRCDVIYDFLSEETNSELIILAKESSYIDAKIRGGESNSNTRKASIHRGVPDKYESMFERKIKDLIDVNNFEFQMTMNTNGDFYKPHPDTDPNSVIPIIKNRKYTCIYYMFDTPKSFSGGDLIIYDKTDDFYKFDQDNFEKIVVENNMLLYFPCEHWHEVTLITNDGQLDNNRFTVNAWCH